ncbi:hypothetical protein K227x_25920 [Rubripirellula lacrimiformis]|uniref:Uncharacterized protein n=2 Tax=Rubripirellula lacrimiformis TaxID=1930273 RepID=A0A517NAP3_9BACT|nr:hypothetical protein K227x_25920 [Rubripirellula lacrimiformis]
MMLLVESLGSETRHEFRPWMMGMAESLGDLRYGMMRLVESLGSETRQEFRPWMMGDGRKSWRLALRDDAVGRKSW